MNIEGPYDPNERRQEAMTEGSGFSTYVAASRLSSEVIPGTKELPQESSHKPRASRRGGRAYPEMSGRDMSREIANQFAAESTVSPETQRDINRLGRAMADAALDTALGKDRHIAAIEAEVNALIPIDPDNVAGSEAARERMTNARLRTYFDSKK